MFAFAYYNKETKELILARDYYGEKPLYYSIGSDGYLYFASTIKSLLAYRHVSQTISKEKFAIYLGWGYYPQDITPFDEINKVTAGKILVFGLDDSGKTNLKYARDIVNEQNYDGDGKFISMNNISRVVKNSIKHSLVSDVGYSLSLSAGIDSSLILGVSRKASLYKPEAYTIRFFDDAKIKDEAYLARQFAYSMGMANKIIIVDKPKFVEFKKFVGDLVTPVADISGFAQYKVAESTYEDGHKVLMVGTGADEIYFGYPFLRHAYFIMRRMNKLFFLKGVLKDFKIPKMLWRFLRRQMTYRSIKDPYYSLLMYFYGLLSILTEPSRSSNPPFMYLSGSHAHVDPKEFSKNISNMTEIRVDRIEVVISELLKSSRIKNFSHQNIIKWIRKEISRNYLEGNLLSMSDSVGMANSVEIRTPFLDLNSAKLTNMKEVSNKLLKDKNILRTILAEFDHEKIVLNKQKSGFVPPTTKWINSLLENFQTECGNFTCLIENGLLRNDIDINEIPNSYKYKILVAELWFRELLNY